MPTTLLNDLWGTRIWISPNVTTTVPPPPQLCLGPIWVQIHSVLLKRHMVFRAGLSWAGEFLELVGELRFKRNLGWNMGCKANSIKAETQHRLPKVLIMKCRYSCCAQFRHAPFRNGFANQDFESDSFLWGRFNEWGHFHQIQLTHLG